ncbi:ABC transporter ATP-binding protein [Fusibacter bizertensis]
MHNDKCGDINIDHIKVGYGNEIVIEDMSLQVPVGKITTIIGPNGCGKSTLLKTIGRLIPKLQGSVIVEGKDVATYDTKELAKKMAILPQSPLSPEGITVEELIAYGRFPHQKGLGRLKESDEQIVSWAMKITNLIEIRDKKVDSLSGGQRQRVWIALALAQQTPFILLDEPTTYLDMAYQLEVLELIEHLNKFHGATIVMVLHDLNLASRFSDHMIAIRDGEIVCSGTPNEVMGTSQLRAIYGIDPTISVDPKTQKPICVTYDLIRSDQSMCKKRDETDNDNAHNESENGGKKEHKIAEMVKYPSRMVTDSEISKERLA